MGPAASPTGQACRARQDPTTAGPRNNSPSTPKHCVFRPFWACWANFFALAPTPGRPGRQISRTGRRKGDIETDDASARPQHGTTETGITTAPTNCTKNAPFSPAKATAVSIPHRHQQAQAITVSDHRATSPAAPRHSAPSRCLAATPVGSDPHGRRRHHLQPNVARHLSRSIFETPHKHCDSNDTNSMFD